MEESKCYECQRIVRKVYPYHYNDKIGKVYVCNDCRRDLDMIRDSELRENE